MLCFSCEGSSIGQNLYMSRVYQGYSTINVTNVIDSGWYGEKKFYTYDSLECESNQMCGHYTAVRDPHTCSAI